MRTFALMDKVNMVRLLQELLADSRERERLAEERARRAEAESGELHRQVCELRAQLSHMISLLEKSNVAAERLAGELKLYSPKKCERITDGMQEEEPCGDPPAPAPPQEDLPEKAGGKAPSRWDKARSRGNNNARRKEYFCTEVRTHEVWPDSVGPADRASAKVLREREAVRYEYIPGSFVKHVYKLKVCEVGGRAETPHAPPAPFFNSNFDSSFMAGILQLRYAYFLPLERITRLFNESGFDVGKGTLDGLLARTYRLIGCMDEVMHKAVLEDGYINMDESYLTVLERGARSTSGIYSSKAYVWCAQARRLKLVHMFYNKGSRGKEMLTGYLPGDYRGAIQSDGLVHYREVEGGSYPGVLHLTCWQHCKRDFLDIRESTDARRIVAQINMLYRKDHQIKEDWPPERIVAYRQEYAPPIFEKIKQTVREVLDKPTTLPRSELFRACNKLLNQFDALCNYVRGAEYDLDNNAIERTMRVVSMSRRSSLFAASHQGAKRSALFYSLACSCRLHDIDTFEYFKDIIERVAKISDVSRQEQKLRELLPDKWRRKG